MSLTYYVALPFLRTDDAIVPGQPQEVPNEHSAMRLAETMSRKPEHRRNCFQASRRSQHGDFFRRDNSEIVRGSAR